MIWLKKIKKLITTGYNPGEKYMAQIVRTPNMSQDELEQRIANSTSMTAGDVSNALKAFAYELGMAVASGRGVVTSVGTYQVQLKVKAVSTLEEVTTDTVEKINIRFYPNKSLQKAYEKAGNKLEFVDVTGKGYQDPSEEPVPVP